MSIKNTHSAEDLAFDIRSAIRGELEAINEYTAFARRAPMPEAAALFIHIADEERHHVVELFGLPTQVDPAQRQAYMDVFARDTRAHDVLAVPACFASTLEIPARNRIVPEMGLRVAKAQKTKPQGFVHE
ncbi:MAG: ferritin family protein [Bacteroidota bacterium]